MEKSKLFIVSTPIGNLEDLSPRAIRILNEVDLIAAEDTRITGKLLSRFSIITSQISFNTHNAITRIPFLMEELKTKSIALTTDAGAPGVSDPGSGLIKAADEVGIEVIAIPGPSSLTAIMSLSPFESHRTYFYGFAPRNKTELVTIMKDCDGLKANCVFYESPNRLEKLLSNLNSISQTREVVIGRELTKLHEERFVGTVKDALDYFVEPKGEFTLLLKPIEISDIRFSSQDYETLVKKLTEEGLGVKAIAKEISAISGKTNSQAYRLVLDHI